MTKRGPKPADVRELRSLASMFTGLFLGLRDGRDSQILSTKSVAKTRTDHGTVVPLGKHQADTGEDGRIVDSGGELVVGIIPATARKGLSRQRQAQFEKRARKFLSQIVGDPEFQARRVWIEPPVFARQDLWTELKDARSAVEMSRVTKKVAKWMRPYAHLRWRRALQAHAAELFRAKQELWTYPRSNRPKSDNKRAEFFGKALAGLVLGKSPATAMKSLHGWSPLKPPLPAPPIRALGPHCPHCGIGEVEGFSAGTVVRCPGCDQRYYIVSKRRKTR